MLQNQHLLYFISHSLNSVWVCVCVWMCVLPADSSVLNQNQTWRVNDMSNLTYYIQRREIDSVVCVCVCVWCTIKLLKQTNLMRYEARQATEMRATFTTIRCLNWMSKRQFALVLLPPSRLQRFSLNRILSVEWFSSVSPFVVCVFLVCCDSGYFNTAHKFNA